MSDPLRGWKTVELGSVCEVIAGAGFPKKHQGKSEGEYPFYKVSDMNLPGNERYMRSANNYIDEETRGLLKAKAIPERSVIFPKIGAAIATNKKRLLTQSACVDNNVVAIAPSENVDPAFLFFRRIQF